MAYANGQVPLHLLVKLGEQLYLPPGTAARWRWFVAEGKGRFGVTFRVTGPSSRGWDGWNCYRPLDIQRKYKNAFGQWAASPGYSSHGGFYQGREVFAIDVANWASVSWGNFTALANQAGFRVDFVSPREQWHIGDFNNPWIIPAFAAGNSEDNDLTPDQDARLRNIEALLAGTGPSLQDPTWGAGQGSVLAHLQNLTAFTYAGGTSVSDPSYVASPGTIYNLLKAPVHRTFVEDGKTVTKMVPQIQDNADTNTMVRQLVDRPAVSLSDAQLKVIADTVAKQISGDKPVAIDYAMVAEAVREKLRSDPLK